MERVIYIVTISYYNKKHEYKKMLTSYINPSIEVNQNYVLNTIPTIQKDDMYLIENIEIEKKNLAQV